MVRILILIFGTLALTSSLQVADSNVCHKEDFTLWLLFGGCSVDANAPQFDAVNLTLESGANKTDGVNDNNDTVVAEDEEPLIDKREDPIATFDEWTKEKLKEKQQNHHPPASAAASENGHTKGTQTDTEQNNKAHNPQPPVPQMAANPERNYASKECGAKVLLANPEAENKGALLKEKDHDDYMRNPCDVGNKFVIIELCETVQPTLIEIANYELFSSNPKQVRVWGSERFPCNDWALIGEWTAGDIRKLQSFYPNNNRIYSKFLKVELLSHYDAEHYCTLSLVRVFGISMVDEYEAEAQAEAMNSQVNTPAATQEENLEPVPEINKTRVSNDTKHEDNNNIVGAVKDAVRGVFDRASAAILGRKKEQLNATDCDWFYFKTNWKYRANRCLMCHKEPKSKSSRFCHYFGARQKEHFITPKPAPKVIKTVTKKKKKVVKKCLPRPSTQRLFLNLLRRVAREAELKDALTPKRPTVAVAPNGNATVAAAPRPTVALPGSSTSNKESVFIRLNNRIKALELNISLSGQYLSELSRKYVNQMEEIQKQYNRTLRKLNETSKRAEEKSQQQAAELLLLKIKLEQLNQSHLELIDKIDTITGQPIFDPSPNTVEELKIWISAALLLQAGFVLLIVFLCCRPSRSRLRHTVAEEIARHVISAPANERLPVANGHLPANQGGEQFPVTEESCPNSPWSIPPARKRKRKKNQKAETDSAVESRCSPTPTPSELSSELEIHLNDTLTAKAHSPKRRSSSADRERSPPWVTVPGKSKKKEKVQKGKVEQSNRFGALGDRTQRRPRSDIY